MKNQTFHLSVAQRILAGMLALIMLFSTVVLLLTRIVSPDREILTEKAVLEAFDTLSRDDDYLNAPAVSRVRMLFERMTRKPQSAEDYEQIAAIYAGRGAYGEAAELYQNCVDATDDDNAAALADRYLKLASARVLNGELESAADGYQRSLRYAPTSLSARMLLAQVYIELKAYQKAAEQMALYLTLVPNDTESRRLLGNLQEAQGKYALAYQAYHRVYQATGAPEDCLNCARTAAMVGDDDAAIRLFTTYFSHAEDADGSGHYLRGIAYLRRAEYAAAEADLLAAIERGFSDEASCNTYLTICTYAQNEMEDTIFYGERAAALWQTPDGECLQRMGLSALQLERYEAAEDYFLRSLTASPALTENYYFLASVYLLEQDYEAARGAFGRSIDAAYMLQQCYYNRAICSLQLGDYASAAEDLQKCLISGDDEATITSAQEFLSQLGVSVTE